MIDVRFQSVSKRYRVRKLAAGEGDAAALARRTLAHGRGLEYFWAVRDVSFEVRRGEAVGIIGENGAGKSTILKMLSGITAPTAGEIRLRGRLSAMIEVGSGFHPELTGRENVFLTGSILGMRRAEIAAKLDSIVEFAGVRAFLDVPVKWYSSGMYVRLGFAIAAHLNPDILLLDEVLAVGDAAFQTRCLERIHELKREGKTILFISHDLSAVEGLCDRAMLMHGGQVISDGSPGVVISQYRSRVAESMAGTPVAAAAGSAAPPAEVIRVVLRDHEGVETDRGRTGWPLTLRVEYRAREPIDDAAVEIFYRARHGRFLYCHYSTAIGRERFRMEPGAGAVEFHCAELGLQPGVYEIGAAIRHRMVEEPTFLKEDIAILHVEQGCMVSGFFHMPHTWRLVEQTGAAQPKARQPQIRLVK